MNKLSKQTVYLPVKVDEEFWKKWDNGEKPDYDLTNVNTGENIESWVNEQEGYFFTPQQLNEYTANVIKKTHEITAEKVELKMFKKSQYSKNARWKKVSKKEAEEGVDIFSYQCQTRVDKQSIRNTFEQTFKQFEV